MYVAEQFNGERIRYESWVINMWVRKELTDPMLLGPLESAKCVYNDGDGRIVSCKG
jgi:hypothetical protein